ncbi:MAG: hypothetical protein IH614_15205 [Desulfuromonadales bacterium]|nr:hypothetical protein [Desulfuromonadales bacterium]
MERPDFEKCCQALEEGEEIVVQNLGQQQSAKVLFCRGDLFEVRVEGKRQSWQPEMCEEVAGSSESPHRNL